HTAVLPHESITGYARVMAKRLGQVWLSVTSLELTVTPPPQFSEMVPPWTIKPAESVAGAGAAEAHWTVTFVGQVIAGAVVSLTVMVWLHVWMLPHRSLTV